MCKKEIHVQSIESLLPTLCELVEHYEINVSKMCDTIHLPRSTYYDFVYNASPALERIQKVFSYLGIDVSIKLTKK